MKKTSFSYRANEESTLSPSVTRQNDKNFTKVRQPSYTVDCIPLTFYSYAAMKVSHLKLFPSRSTSSHHCPHHIAMAVIVAFFVLSVPVVSGFALSPVSPRASATAHSILHATGAETNADHDPLGDDFWTRRETLSRTASSVLAASALGVATPSVAAEASAAATKQEIISKLAGIPTFCLVNGPDAGPGFDGVPFTIYDANSAVSTGFFFMNYDSALLALKTASDLDSSRGDGNIWATAKVKVVPLSVAIQLSLSRRRRVAINEEKGVGGIQVDTINNVIPSDEANADAQRLDTSRSNNPKKWETKGRVPLFYIPEARLQRKYYYFETNSLIADYKRRHAGDDPSLIFLPEIQLVEFVDVFRKAQQSNNWESLRDFVETIQPSPDAREAAIKLLKEEAAASKKPAPYNLDKAYLVVAAGKK